MSNVKVQYRTQCPACAKKGNDRKGNNLVVYEDGGRHCFACSFHVGDGGRESFKFELPPHRAMPPEGHKTRGISKEVLDLYGVVNLVDDERPTIWTGTRHEYPRTPKILYPYYNQTNRLIGCKVIDYSKSKEEGGRFSWKGDSDFTVFGSQLLDTKGAENLLIVEGENDAMAARQMLGMKTPWVIVGVSGTGNIERLQKINSTLRNFKRIYVCMDADDPGQLAQEEILKAMPPGKAYAVQLPSGYKDANDCLLYDGTRSFIDCIQRAKQVINPCIISKEDLLKRVFDYQNRSSERAIHSTGIQPFDEEFGGFAPGRLVTFVGDTGIGKSTLVEQLAVNAAKQNKRSLVMSLEMSAEEVVTRMLQGLMGTPCYSDPEYNWSKRVHPQERARYSDFISDMIKFYSHVGAVSVDSIIDAMLYAIDVFNVEIIVLDNYTSASDSLDWKDLDLLAKRIKTEVCLAKDVCVLSVSHISRDGFREGDTPTLRNIRGGVGIAQQSDVVVGIGRQRESNVTEVSILKNRINGKKRDFALEYTDYNFVYSPYKNSYSSPPSLPSESEFLPEVISEEAVRVFGDSLQQQTPNIIKVEDNASKRNAEQSVTGKRDYSCSEEPVRGGITEKASQEGHQIREPKVGVSSAQNLHTRLGTTERHSGRKQRVFCPTGQEEILKRLSLEPTSRFTTSVLIPKWTPSKRFTPEE